MPSGSAARASCVPRNSYSYQSAISSYGARIAPLNRRACRWRQGSSRWASGTRAAPAVPAVTFPWSINGRKDNSVEFTDIKAPEPVAGIPPWQDPAWVAEAEGWISAESARDGLARTGPALARGRPYSVVARVPTSGGTVWFKASPPAARFEPALVDALATWLPDQFPPPVAVDQDRAWSLTRGGGPAPRQARAG